MQEQKLAIIIFELGKLQVYHYQTMTEWTHKIAPKEVFWLVKDNPIVHGPFLSAYDAVNDYTKSLNDKEYADQQLKNLISIDFKAKKRL